MFEITVNKTQSYLRLVHVYAIPDLAVRHNRSIISAPALKSLSENS